MNAKIVNAFGPKGRVAGSLEHDDGQWAFQRKAASEQGAL
jgi:hypothetical protein